ncbi:PAAR domain-containing protein [Amantichitinum ursilacus]|uniref:PAAR motif protein n=1 Tax=Amantichitinum ursilacus TaxID=857265 RepID=A0A0N0XGC2_9NEIS|nr:PAAR domain-containing protein [Amantichitinum ursilacus]KPC49649.1 hypothetical protein WG78_20040 [Amantichitinum ursilacus]
MGVLAGIGDRTTSGGEIISASSTYIDGGKQLCVSGDKAWCKACRGAFPVSGTATHWADNGNLMVQDGDRVLCRCADNRVIAHSSSYYDQTPAPAIASFEAIAAVSAPPANTFDDRFRLLSGQTGQPLPGIEYAVRRATGALEYGVTDALGCTHLVVNREKPEMLAIYC